MTKPTLIESVMRIELILDEWRNQQGEAFAQDTEAVQAVLDELAVCQQDRERLRSMIRALRNSSDERSDLANAGKRASIRGEGSRTAAKYRRRLAEFDAATERLCNGER